MRTALALACLLAAYPASAQTVAPPPTAPTEAETREKLEAFKKQREETRKKLAPASIEKDPVAKLFERLVKDGQYERTEGDRSIGVRLIEVETPEPEGDIRNLLYTRTFSHMEASEQVITVDDKGEATADIYVYVIGLDGQLLGVTRSQLKILGQDAEGAVVVDPKRSRSLILPPSDMKPRWKKLSKELLKLGKTVEV